MIKNILNTLKMRLNEEEEWVVQTTKGGTCRQDLPNRFLV